MDEAFLLWKGFQLKLINIYQDKTISINLEDNSKDILAKNEAFRD